jgi:hypothetical protein
MTRLLPAGVACALLLFLPACSEQPSNRVDLWGTVTFKGRPVPAGLITINPDLSKGNDGPQGMAEIRDGHYDTRLLDKGAPSGAVILMIDGFDGVPQGEATSGAPLFLGYRLSMDIPKESTDKNIEVPDSAAAKANAAPVQLP